MDVHLHPGEASMSISGCMLQKPTVSVGVSGVTGFVGFNTVTRVSSIRVLGLC